MVRDSAGERLDVSVSGPRRNAVLRAGLADAERRYQALHVELMKQIEASEEVAGSAVRETVGLSIQKPSGTQKCPFALASV